MQSCGWTPKCSRSQPPYSLIATDGLSHTKSSISPILSFPIIVRVTYRGPSTGIHEFKIWLVDKVLRSLHELAIER